MKKFFFLLVFFYATLNFVSIFAQVPLFGDVLFSEIMANPGSEKSEYVELYNAGEKPIQLSNCVFFYGDKPYKLPEKTVAPKSYVILCKTTALSEFSELGNAVGVASFPILANAGKLLMLKDLNDNLISWFEYSDKMYVDTEKKSGGWSLECIDLSNLSNLSDNWSASAVEHGTPGKSNSVQKKNPDTTVPALTSCLIEEGSLVKIGFSKPMDEKSLLDFSAYLVHSTCYEIDDLQTNYPYSSEVYIRLNQFPIVGELVEIELIGVHDLSGCFLDKEECVVSIGRGFEAESGDLVISELLFNPPTGGNEYVELYNASEKAIDLRYLSITSRKPSDNSFNKLYPLTDKALFLYPGDYLVVTKKWEAVKSNYSCRDNTYFVELEKMPSIANASGCVVILNNQNESIVDEFAYNEKMHSSGISAKKGVALEKMDLKKPSSETGNWQSASADSGYGTPGYQNSQSLGIGLKNGIAIELPSIVFDNYRIVYQLDKSGYKCRAFVYDSLGKMVDVVVNNETLGTSGELVWTADEIHLPTGIYIVYVELYDERGEVKKFKQVFIR